MRVSLRFALAVAASPLAAQTRDSVTAGPALSLEDALRLARGNNTDLQQTLETRRTARASQRAAYGSLLPSVDASFGGQYQEGGRQIYNGVTLGTNPNTIGSNYALSVNYNVNASSIIAPRVAAATRDAVEADISGATESLASLVTQQYLTVLQASAKAALADTLRREHRLIAQTVYECPSCAERFLGERRCDDCNLMCRKLELDGRCVACDEIMTVADLLGADL